VVWPGFKVGNVEVQTPLVLAPMEDVSSLPMRVIAKRIGQPGLMFTEFVSAMAIHYNARGDPLQRPQDVPQTSH